MESLEIKTKEEAAKAMQELADMLYKGTAAHEVVLNVAKEMGQRDQGAVVEIINAFNFSSRKVEDENAALRIAALTKFASAPQA